MVTKIDPEIFLPLEFNVYKRNKINLLKTHVKTVNTLERIKRLNELQKIKAQQRRLLRKILKEIKSHYENIQNSLPTGLEVGIPELIQKDKSNIPQRETTSAQFQPTSRIDEELNKIQEKLKNLKI